MNQKIKEIREMIAQYKASIPFICELKLTERCNLNCEYCYRGEHSGKVIDPGMVLSFFDELAEYYPHKLVCSFHGGEPLAAYDALKEIVLSLRQRPYSDRVVFSVQTNGTCITEEVADFFKKEKVAVGVSVDANNDASRVYPGGKGTFRVIEQNIEMMIRKGIEVSATCVVTNKNIDFLKDYLLWCRQIGIRSLSFNFARITPERDAELKLVPDVKKYADVMKELVDLQIEINRKDSEKTAVFEFMNIVNKAVNPFFDCFVCNSPCKAGTRIACLNVDGLLERCDCVMNVESNIIGEYRKGNLKELLLHAKETDNPIRHECIEECRTCAVEKICPYGCRAESIIFDNGRTDRPGKRCEYYKEIIPYLLGKLEQGVSPDLFLIDK